MAGIDAYRRVADELKERLIARMVEAGEPAPKIEDAEARTGGQRQVSIEESRVKL